MHPRLGHLKIVLKDKHKKKSLLKIARELSVLAIAKKEIPYFYGAKYLYRDDGADYKYFISAREEEMVRFSPGLHTLEYTTLLKNKLASALYFKECGLSIPKMPSYNVNRIFFSDGKQTEIKGVDELESFFLKVFEKTGFSALFLKALAESGGVGCYLLKEESLRDTLNAIAPKLLSGAFVHQERLKQHPDIDNIYSHSINSLRFETYIDNRGKVHIIEAYIRIGVGGNFVDNASTGGVYAGIDMETGKLKGKGFQKMKGGSAGNLFTTHPDTGYPLQDFKIPYFKEACDLALKAVSYVPDRYIGWDIAIAETGPVLIEGNGSPQLGDLAYGGLLKNPVFVEALEEAKKSWPGEIK